MIASVLNRQAGLVIFVLALVLRLAWVATLDNRLAWLDEQEFAAVGEHIALGDGYVSTSYRANPVVPYYLGGVFRLFGQQYLVARIGQCILGALTCVLLYRLGSVLIDRATGILSGVMLAAYPPHIYVAGVFYVDCWLTFLCALSALLAALTLRARGHVGLALLCGVSLGLMALTRPTFLCWVPSICIAWIYGGRWGWRRETAACAVLLAGCALTILPWTVRNYRVYGRPMLISSGFYTTLWRGNNPLADGGADDRHLMWYTPMWHERLQRLPEDDRRALEAQYQTIDRLVRDRYAQLNDQYLATDEVLKPIALESVLSDPARTAVLMLKKVRTLFSAFSGTETQNTSTNSRNRWLAALSFYPVLILALVGTCIGLPRRRELALLYLVILSVVASYALLTACTRFRLPVDPFLMVFASLALTRIVRAAAGQRRTVSDRAWEGVAVESDRALAEVHPASR